ncbi:AbrB family transcriptional regulator [Sphaerothrix gracilis]|uniref:AbrB family transcriptional regulator n=1 Tax=Sphaerothrix gracilis TaxID=3151835 RepID=UPI0031FBB375
MTRQSKPLTGKALLQKAQELSHLSRREIAQACGYTSQTKSNRVRVSLESFYEALLVAKGLNLGPKSDGRGREATYRLTVHQNGQIVIGSAYTQELKLKPGDEFDLKLGYKHIHLRQVEEAAASEA